MNKHLAAIPTSEERPFADNLGYEAWAEGANTIVSDFSNVTVTDALSGSTDRDEHSLSTIHGLGVYKDLMWRSLDVCKTASEVGYASRREHLVATNREFFGTIVQGSFEPVDFSSIGSEAKKVKSLYTVEQRLRFITPYTLSSVAEVAYVWGRHGYTPDREIPSILDDGKLATVNYDKLRRILSRCSGLGEELAQAAMEIQPYKAHLGLTLLAKFHKPSAYKLVGREVSHAYTAEARLENIIFSQLLS